MAHIQEKGKGLGGKFIKTWAPGDSQHLAIEKIDEIVLAVNALIAQFNAFLAHVDTANVAGIGNTNVTNYAGAVIPKTASDVLVPSPSKTNL
jgi:hypothetical protein